jgi:RNA polymerase sigma-70 factor (ECF subfamily)
MFGKQMESEELALTMTSSTVEHEESSSRTDSAQALERAMAGDRAAFDELILCFERRVFRTAWRLLGSKEDAQDAAQEVFLRLYRHLRRVDPKRPLLPWLYRITVNVCHDMRRKRRWDTMLPEEPGTATVAIDPTGEITRVEQKRVIAEALKTLTEKERAAIILRDIEGLSTAEVASTLGSSETTIRSQISTGRVKIRKFVDRMEKRRS